MVEFSDGGRARARARTRARARARARAKELGASLVGVARLGAVLGLVARAAAVEAGDRLPLGPGQGQDEGQGKGQDEGQG